MPRNLNTRQPNPRWMETHCNPGDANLGIERDWLSFFHALWTTSGAAAFEIAEMIDVFDQIGDSNPEWHHQLEGVEDIWGASSVKYDLYREKGGDAGVDHFKADPWDI